MLPPETIAAYSYERRLRQWTQWLQGGESGPPAIFVVERAGTIAGFAAGGPNRDPADPPDAPGELYSIYVLRAHHGFGVGRALFTAVMDELRLRNLLPACCWVLDGNPASAFYERVGGTHVKSQRVQFEGADVVERCYRFS